MKLKYLLNIFISLVLMLVGGVISLGPVPISSAANVEYDGRPVSVAPPADLSGGIYTWPVSVGIPQGAVGETNSKPVSIGIPTGVAGDTVSKPVSVSPSFIFENGSYPSWPISVSVQSANTGDPDLVGLYHMDGDWGDSSGNNNHGSPINGVAFSGDKKVGTQSGSFDGVDDYVSISNNSSLNPGQITIEGWIKINNFVAADWADWIIQKGLHEWDEGFYGLGLSSDSRSLITYLNIGGGSSNAYGISTPITTGDWHHIAMTYDNLVLRLYLNGSLVNSKTINKTRTTNTQSLLLGRRGDSGYYFKGLIDEVTIYKRALTAEEVAVHYATGVTDPAAPAAPALDPVPAVVGTSTITLSGTKTIDTSIWVNKKKVAAFDNLTAWQGSYSTLLPGINILNVTAVDASYRQSQPATATIIYDNQPPVIESSYPSNNSSTAKAVTAITINLTDNYSSVDLAGSIQGAVVKNSAGQTIQGGWSTSGTKAIKFIPSDTLLADTYTVTIYPVDAVGNKGQQQLVFITYDIAPPVTKLTLSGTKGLDGWYSTLVTLTLTADDGTEGSGVDKTEYSFDNTTWQAYTTPFALDKDGTATLYYRSVDKAGNVETPAKSNVIKINKTGLVGLWHMDNDNWIDSSVVGHNGINNGSTFNTNAKLGTHSGSFNGTSNYVKIYDSEVFLAMQNISVVGWINPGRIAASGTRQTIVSFKEGDNPTVGAVLALPEDATNKMRFWVKVNDVWQSATSTRVISPDTWYHVSGIYDGATISIYIDGVLEGRTTAFGNMSNAIGSSTSTITIGARASNNTHWFHGRLDEISIYNRALSLREVQELYRSVTIQPPMVDHIDSPTASAIITLSGTKPENTAIVVNGITIASLDASTTWQGAYTLKSGMNTLNVSAMDQEGFHSQELMVSVVLDDTPPVIASSVPANNAFINTPISSVSLNLTDAYSTIDLAATTNVAFVKNSSGQDVPGAWTTSGNSTVIFTPSNSLSEGAYTVTIYPTDSFGNKTTAQITFNYDATAPPAPFINAALTPTNIAAQVLSGTKSSDTTSIVITTSPAATVGAVSYPTGTTWSVTVSSLREGTNTITAYAKDSAGNQSAGISTIIIYDSIPPAAPTVNVTSPTKDTIITLTGIKESNASIWINNTKKVEIDSSTTWQGTFTLQSGPNILNITAKDAAGNQSGTTTVTVILDDKAPVIESSVPVNNSDTAKVVANVTINLTDTYSPVNLEASFAGATVKNASGQTIADPWTTSGTKTIIFTPSNPLPEDTYTVTIYPVDTLGNKGTQQFVFTNHDITKPVTTIALSGTKDSAGWYSTIVTVTLTANDGGDGAGIEKTEYSFDNINWNLYSAPFVVNKDGISNVKYRSTDKAGNIETAKSQEIKINLTGIVGWWRMDGNWQDSSVVGNNGTANGATFSTNAKIGARAGSFDGVDDYVTLPVSLLNTTITGTPYTFEFWFKGAASQGRIFGWYKDNNNRGYVYWGDGDSPGNYYFNNNTNVAGTWYIKKSATLLTNTWYHVVLSFETGNTKLYVNGVEDTTTTGIDSNPKRSGVATYFAIGTDYWNNAPNQSTTGLLDEVIIYNRALSDAEIKAHFDAASVAQPVVDTVTSPTASQTLPLSGTKQANTSIRVNGMEIVPLDASTTWQGTYTLQSGSNTLNITAMDAGGYQSASVTITVIYDNIPPTISGSAPSNNASVNTLITSVTINLTDAYSAIDLTATTNGAMVKNSSGQDISGAWTTSGSSTVIFTPSDFLSEGAYTVTIYPTDFFGNKTTAQIAFNYDATAPPAPAINAVVSPTNIAAQVISGTKSSDTVAITFVTSPGLTVGTVSYPTNTSWSVLISGLKEGENSVTAYAKDSAGNQSTGVSASIVYDSAAPAAPVINALMSPTKNTSVTLTGTKEANTYLYVNGTKTSVMFIDEAWSYTVSLNEGANTIIVYAKDGAGNQSASASVSVTRDTTPPVISSATPLGNSFINQAGTIDILLADSYSSVDLSSSITGGANVKDPSGNIVAGLWTISGAHIIFTPQAVMAANGAYTVIIYPTDSLGNTGTASFSFTMDTTPPQVQSLTMNPASPHKAEIVTFTFTFNEDVLTNVVPTVTFGINSPYNTYPLSGTWTNARTWQASYTFSNTTGDGTYKVMVSDAKDEAGNVMTASEAGSFVLDTGTPSKPVIDPITTPTKTAAITISGTKPANTGITINGAQKVSLDSLTTWSCAYTLTEGANNLSVRAINAAGNESIPVIAAVVLDTVVPRISTSSPSNGASMNLVTKIDILLVDDTTSVDLNNSLTGASVKLAGQSVSGAWSIENSHLIFTPSGQLAAGAYYVTIYPVDVLGNKATINIAFTVDLTPSLVQSLTMTPSSPHKAEAVTFAVTFNEDMTTTQQPTVTFTKGASYPTYTITGSWTNAKTWSGAYTFTAGTGDGTYTVSVSGAKDKAGNTMNPQDAGTFMLDTISPSSPAISAVTTPTKAPNQTISGTKPADTAIIINGIERVALNSSTSWSYTYPLSEGQNNISVTARDAAGNDSSPVTTAITLDTTPPSFVINTYKNPSPTPTQILTGTKEAGCIVKLNGVTIFDSMDQNTTWSHTVTLTEGLSSHFVFTASDALGNTITKAIDILYDASAPGQLGPGILVADGSGKGTEITLSWTAYVETPDIAYYRIFMSTANFTDTTGMTPIGTANKGIKTFKITGLTQGSTYYFAVVPVDISGNFTPLVNTAAGIPKDTAAPEDVAITSVTAGYDIVSGNNITLKWNPSVNSTGDLADQAVYFDDGKGYDSGTALGKIVTIYTKTGLNDATKYKFKITVKDTLAHESNGVITEGVTRLPNPSALSANPGNAKITLSWSAVSSPYVKQYNIYRLISDVQQKDIKTMLLIKSVSASTYTYIDTGLTNNTDYQYAVTTLNTYGAERTDVLSITARPRMDTTGPVIGSLNITQGQVITAPITISASATDAESSVGKIELYIDGALVKTSSLIPPYQGGSEGGVSLSYFYNVIETTDGNHTIKLIAYDQYGNITEAERQVVVSLAPPSTPSITGHAVTQTTPKYLVNVSGTTARYTTVILRVNGVVVYSIPPYQGGTEGGVSPFTFSSVELKEGDNFLAVKASHRGGESQYSPDYKIVVDTGAPPSPQNLTSQILPGGAVRLSWQNAAGEIPSGYNLYMSTSSFGAKTETWVIKTNTTPILYLFNDYTPPSDSLRYYAVTSVDSAGNESGISNVVSASSDRVAPYVISIAYTYTPSPLAGEGGGEGVTIAGIGTVKVKVTVNEPLKELPFFSLEPQEGSPIVISLTQPPVSPFSKGELEGTESPLEKGVQWVVYEGTFSVTALIESGTTTYKFSGKDMTGNRGTAQGAGITIDASGPGASIQSPLTVLQIKTEPVTVNIAFNESSVTVPVMELRSSSGLTSAITGLYTSDNGVHWTGAVDISALPEGNAEFKLIMAKDKLGNIGTTVSSGKTILIYRDSVPSPDTPSGLTTKTGKAGVITLTWNPIGSASSYNLYRRAENDTTTLKIKTGMLGSPSQDTPPLDGIYYYSVTSVGLLDSESPRSPEVQGVSDRTGPPAPINLALMLDSTGVVATWTQPPESPLTKGELEGTDSPLEKGVEGVVWAYALYRSNSLMTTTSGLTPLINVGITKAVDVSPSRTYRFYAVASHDILGNEGPLSESKEINFPVSPVRDLVLEKIDDAAPMITWLAPFDGDTMGYYIYRNGNRITSYPVTVLSYTDGYYSGGNIIYGVSAVNNLGVEGPIKEVMLPDITIGLKQGTVLRRGLLETIPVILSLPYTLNAIPYTLSVDTLSIKVGTAPSSIMQGPFTLTANSTLQVEKVAATTADAPSFVSVLATASWSPSPGVTVKITKTSSAEVTGSSTALEIFSEPLIRGVDAKIRLKVNNLGTSLMEFLTSENSGETKKVKVNLKDQDGNLLSTGYLNQRTGSMIVNIGSYAVARLNPGENIITDPITINVPQSAPYRVIIEAAIENTYYHYGKPDQVTAPGMTQSIETTISETAYRAFASPEKTFYPYAQPVVITGSAISNNSPLEKGGEGGYVPMPFVPVKLGISIKGFDRYYTVTTDANGNFTYTFTPGSNEAGFYTLWAVHPDIKDRAVQATFAIAGLSMSPETATVRMARNRTIDIPVSLYNYGGGTLTGLTFETTAGTGITASVLLPSPLAGEGGGEGVTLTAGKQQNITLRLTSSTSASDTTYATMKAKVNEGLSKTLNANISIVQLIPVITTSPSYIDTGMVRGNQKIATFNISNAGEETLRNARIEGPSTSWMSLTVNRAIGDIQPGVSKTVGIMFSPPSTLSQGVYDDTVVIYSDNHIPYTYHIQVTVTSNAVGNVLFDVLNELMEDVPGATITLQHQLLPELIYTLKTAADGTVMLYDIPEGRYTYNVSPPPGHMPYSGTFNIYPGITTTVPIALEMTMVTVTWSVTPTVIQDKYEIVVTQTFETNVPAPVLIVEPPNINLPNLAPGQVFNGEFKVTNYGLIEVYDVLLDFPRSIDDYDIEVMTSAMPNKIGAMKSIIVPYRITRRITTASLFKSLYEEVMGYGGSTCVKTFNITVKAKCVICPNSVYQRIVEKLANYFVSIPVDCPSTTQTSPSTYTGGGGSVTIISSSTGGQSGTSGYISGYSPAIVPMGDCKCMNCDDKNPCTDDFCEAGICMHIPNNKPCLDDGNACTNDICSGGACTHPPDDSKIPLQMPNNCKKEICQNGSVVSIVDDSDKPSEKCKDCKNGNAYWRPTPEQCWEDFKICEGVYDEFSLKCLKTALEYSLIFAATCTVGCGVSGPVYPECVALCLTAVAEGYLATDAFCSAVSFGGTGYCAVKQLKCRIFDACEP